MTIDQFYLQTITSKDNREFLKTLLILSDEETSQVKCFSSFSILNNSLNCLLMTPDFKDSLNLESISYVGKNGTQSRYAVTFSYLDVDGKPAIVTIIYTQVY